ncbi:MAG: NYN domain-containing protein [Planctomycetes bacterium]|nr:NYN domain-containing protein [Planctomycetota bacterium]
MNNSHQHAAGYSNGSHGSSILLIDLENFYLAREQNIGVYAATEFSVDLEALSRFVTEVSSERRVTVRRAYANYNTARQSSEFGRWDFFLQKAPKALMERGIEPVQVFRFPGGGNKNAADMRMAMDASVLVAENHRIEQCILVTGDADFIPLILDLKRRGIEVVVIGVRAHTKTVLLRYCDRFEYFEDLLVAAEVEGDMAGQLEEARAALHAILARKQRLPFAAIKPLISRQLRRPFDPTRFDCENTGDFLRTFSERLGVLISEGLNDWEVRLPGTEAGPTVAALAQAHASAHASAKLDVAALANGAAPAAGVEPPSASASSVPVAAPRSPELTPAVEHSVAVYHKLLRFRRPNLHIIPLHEWETITAAIYDMAVDANGVRRDVDHQKLLDGGSDICERAGYEMAYHKVNGSLFQLFKSGCFVCTTEGPEKGRSDFHWTLTAQLTPEIDSLEALRRRVRVFVIRSLKSRLESVGIHTPIDLSVLSEVLDGHNAPPEKQALLRELLDAASAAPLEPAKGFAAGV